MEFGMAAKGLEASCQERAERIYGGFIAARRFDLDEFSDGLDQGLAAFFKPVKTAGGEGIWGWPVSRFICCHTGWSIPALLVFTILMRAKRAGYSARPAQALRLAQMRRSLRMTILFNDCCRIPTTGAIQYNLAFDYKLMTDSVHPVEAVSSRQKTVLDSVVLDINEIQKILPHRYPFLLIDRVLELARKERIVALKNVTINEPFFAGHFPGAPIMPGVLIIEAIAQAGGALLLTEVGDRENKLMVFTSIERAKFRKPVVPGDQLRLEVKVIGWRAVRNMVAARMEGIASVDGRKVAEAIVGCQLIDSAKGRASSRDDADSE